MRTTHQTLLSNHSEFLRTHRGRLSAQPWGFTVASAKAAFTLAVVEAPPPDLAELARTHALYRPDWSTLSAEALTRLGLRVQSQLTYMTLPLPRPAWQTNASLAVRRIADATSISAFSDVQTRGFIEDPASRAAWAPFLSDANVQNARNPDQAFYVGSLGTDAGCALAVRTGKTIGLYAIATLPDHRKLGVSATLMARAIDDAVQLGADTVTLQVATGSYAEGFYQRLGFQTAFITQIYGTQGP